MYYEDAYQVRIDPSVFEDYESAEIDTGLVDHRGEVITKPNPRAKDPIGFAIPTRVLSRRP